MTHITFFFFAYTLNKFNNLTHVQIKKKKISQLFILDDVLNENGFELNLKNSNASKECGNRDTPRMKKKRTRQKFFLYGMKG